MADGATVVRRLASAGGNEDRGSGVEKEEKERGIRDLDHESRAVRSDHDPRSSNLDPQNGRSSSSSFNAFGKSSKSSPPPAPARALGAGAAERRGMLSPP